MENRITSYKNALHDRLETVRKHKATLKPGANLDDSGENARLVQGSLADNSLLNDDIAQNTDVGSSTTLYGHEIPLSRLQAIDPQPFKRRRYERTMVIRDVKRRGRISREVHLRRTERESQTKSPFIRTSIKKLSPIANQIMGKTVEEAITQMRLSKKRVAEVIAEQLELARDTAMATRGMGLGKIQGTAGERVTIRLKDGTPKTIYDRTTLYVARTWINRGPYGMDVNRRARGRRDLLRLPQTCECHLRLFSARTSLTRLVQTSTLCSRSKRL